ncbi:MAG: tripartite tricarboxylate transporter TctB family protein [Sphaerochaetaceae bacterium]|nr:tripartite tricarboxylate transporter TctB family protein [Sphaerochaetaceae bacterium]
MKKKLSAEFWFGLGAILFGIFVIMQSKKLPQVKTGISPGDYPSFVAYIVIILGVVQAVKAFVSQSVIVGGENAYNPKQAANVAILIGGTFLYVFLMKYIGFLFLSPFFLMFLFGMFGYKNKKKGVVISISVSVVIYFLFMYAFQILLPRFNLF